MAMAAEVSSDGRRGRMIPREQYDVLELQLYESEIWSGRHSAIAKAKETTLAAQVCSGCFRRDKRVVRRHCGLRFSPK